MQGQRLMRKCMLRAKIKRPERVRQHPPGLATNLPFAEVRPMVAVNSMGLVPAGRDPRGRSLFSNPCPLCGKPRLSQPSCLGRACPTCFYKGKRNPLRDHPLWKKLRHMRDRCELTNLPCYPRYGGRGIYVCDEWRNDPASFIEWAEANGYSPELEIDRIDNDGPYAPWNCQWITHAENSRKRRNSKCDAQKVRAIRQAIASGISVKTVAREAGISESLAYQIRSGFAWKGI